jgi:antitoxin HigA-1
MSSPNRKLPPVHPGDVLLEDFMRPLELSINQLARDLHVPPNRISAIVHRKRAVSADTAMRLSRYFGVTAAFWINLQAKYDLDSAEDQLAASIKREVRPRPKQAA